MALAADAAAGRLRRRRGATRVAALYPHLEDGHRAEEARASDEFTVYDGWVRSGTPELDPRRSGEPQSASRLQLLAACPFRYFVQHVLGVEPPEALERDRTRWLDAARRRARCCTRSFRLFFERITAAGEKPAVARHAALIEEIAEEQMPRLARADPAAQRARVRPSGATSILFACRAFLALEEEHCREVTPRFFEVPFGLPRADVRGPRSRAASPSPIAPGAAARSRCGARSTASTRAPDGSFQVWDYKTGRRVAASRRSAASTEGGRSSTRSTPWPSRPSSRAPGSPRRVVAVGLLLPGPARARASACRCRSTSTKTREVLDRLLDLLARRRVSRTRSTRRTARFCDYESVCGGAGPPPRGARRPSSTRPTLPALRAFREIHDEG